MFRFAHKWNLSSFSRSGEAYLMNRRFNKYDGLLGFDGVQFLNISHRYGLNLLYEHFMSKNPFVDNKEDVNETIEDDILMHENIRYEVFKNSSIKILEKIHEGSPKEKKELARIELAAIFNFFDGLFYEDVAIDTCVRSSRKRKLNNPCLNNYCPAEGANKFMKKSTITDITLVVEDISLYIDSYTLKENSPVFKSMLESSFKEGREKVIRLPGKKLDDIVLFLSYLKYSCEMNGM